VIDFGTTGGVLTAETLARLKDQYDQLMEDIPRMESVGDAYPVHLPHKMAAELGVQQLGLTTMNCGKEKVKFAPARIDRTRIYEDMDRNMFAFAEGYARGEAVEVPSYMYEECPSPRMIVPQKRSDPKPTALENYLFRQLNEQGYCVTLVNPSFGAMSSGLDKNVKVFMTDKEDRDWKKEVLNFISTSQSEQHPRGRIGITDTPTMVCYLGSHTPLHYEGEKWFYILLDPYLETKRTNFSMTTHDHGINYVYEKRGRMVHNSLPNDLPYFVYNPATIAKNCGVPGYFVVSNFPLPWHLGEVNAKDFSHTPWFLDDWPEWSDRGGYMVRAKGNVLYDVMGPGTYVSRRAIEYEGYTWAPAARLGMVAFDRFTYEPVIVSGVTSQVIENVAYVKYGDAVSIVVPVRGELYRDLPKKVWGGKEVGQEVTFRGQQRWFLPSEEGKYDMFEGMVIEREKWQRTAHAFVETPSHWTGILHGYWAPYQAYNEGGRTWVVHENVCSDPHVVVLFSDFESRKKYYFQHFMHSNYWSRSSNGFTFDEDAVSVRAKSNVERVIEALKKWKRMSVAAIAYQMSLALTQVKMILSMQKRNIMMVSQLESYDLCEFMLVSELSQRIPGTYIDNMTINGRLWAEIIETLKLRDFSYLEFVGHVHEIFDFIQTMRANRYVVIYEVLGEKVILRVK